MLILFVKFLINVCYKCLSTKANVSLIQWNMKEKHLLWRQWLLTREFLLKLLVASWLASVLKFTSPAKWNIIFSRQLMVLGNQFCWLNKISVCSFLIGTHFVSIEDMFLRTSFIERTVSTIVKLRGNGRNNSQHCWPARNNVGGCCVRLPVAKREYCLEFSTTWGRPKISRWPFHSSTTIFEAYLLDSLRFSEV